MQLPNQWRYGLGWVWQEFWITRDVVRRGDPVSNTNGPLDHDLFFLYARETVLLLRNHPGPVLWVGGNEQVPQDDINRTLKNDLRLHPYFTNSNEISKSSEDLSPVSKDPRHVYIHGSLWDTFPNAKGGFADGPNEIQYPEAYHKNVYTPVDSILRLVLLGCLLQILLEQQCIKKAGRFHSLRCFLLGTRKKF